jgi:hypothetical protein
MSQANADSTLRIHDALLAGAFSVSSFLHHI